MRTNSGGRTFRLMEVSTDSPARKNWREVIGNRAEVMLCGVDAFADHLVLSEREGGLPYLRVVDLAAGHGEVDTNGKSRRDLLADSHRIEFSEPAYNASLGTNPEFLTNTVRYRYESFVTPRSVFDYDVRTREKILLKQQPVLGGYDPKLYVTERVHATAADGERIPISVVYRRDSFAHPPKWGEEGNGGAPLLLYGYGSYGISVPVTFSSNRLSLLDRGVVMAFAHIRGGGELGKPWHDAGKMLVKRNTFTDFVAAVGYLIAEGYSDRRSEWRSRVESAGGLLMGAVVNLRPDLFRAVLSHVPFVDVMNTMLDASLPLTVAEYEEWGNPNEEEYFRYMLSYSPYDNLKAAAYPAMLVKTSD